MRDSQGSGSLDPAHAAVLDVLLVERSVTRAARRLGVTPSAVSHTLRLLRHQLDDPLLVPGPDGLALTPRAEAIAAPLHQAMLDLGAAVARGAPFEPASARRSFAISGVDYGELIAVPEIVSRLERDAPGIVLRMEPPAPDLAERLGDGRLDLAIAPALPVGGAILRRKLGAEGFTVLLRGDHPAAGRRWDLDAYLALDHLLIAPRGAPGSVVDEVLAARGLGRRVAVRVTSFLAAPFVVARSALCLTAPAGLAAAFAPVLGLTVRAAPLPLPAVDVFTYWHARVDNDPAHRWLRELMVACFQEPPAVRASRVTAQPVPPRKRPRARGGRGR